MTPNRDRQKEKGKCLRIKKESDTFKDIKNRIIRFCFCIFVISILFLIGEGDKEKE